MKPAVDLLEAALLMLGASMVALLLFGIYAVLTTQSCAQRGGVEVDSGTMLMPMVVGKVTILMPMRRYECVVPPAVKR